MLCGMYVPLQGDYSMCVYIAMLCPICSVLCGMYVPLQGDYSMCVYIAMLCPIFSVLYVCMLCVCPVSHYVHSLEVKVYVWCVTYCTGLNTNIVCICTVYNMTCVRTLIGRIDLLLLTVCMPSMLGVMWYVCAITG